MSTNSPSLLYNNHNNNNDNCSSEDLFNSIDFADDYDNFSHGQDTTTIPIINTCSEDLFTDDACTSSTNATDSSSTTIPVAATSEDIEDDNQQDILTPRWKVTSKYIGNKTTTTTSSSSTSGSLSPTQVTSITDIEACTLRLKLAIEFANKFLKSEAGDETQCPDAYEVIFAARKVSNGAVDLVKKVDMDPGKSEVILEAFFVVAELYEKFIQNEDLNLSINRKNDTMKQIGVDLIVAWIQEFLTRKIENTLEGQMRTNFAQEVVERLKPEPMRRLILIGVIDVLLMVFHRFMAVTEIKSEFGVDGSVDITDIDCSFRLLQILEQIIITTSDSHPWMLTDEVRKLIQLEKICELNLRLFTIQLFVSRVVTVARKKEIVSHSQVSQEGMDITYDISISDDEDNELMTD